MELRREALMTVSPHSPFRARYELRGVTTELTKQRKEDEGVPVAVGRGELRSGEARPWRRQWKNGHWPSPKAWMARLGGR